MAMRATQAFFHKGVGYEPEQVVPAAVAKIVAEAGLVYDDKTPTPKKQQSARK